MIDDERALLNTFNECSAASDISANDLNVNLNLVIDVVNPSTPASTAVNWSSKDLNIFSSSNLTPSTVNFPAKSLAVFLAAAVLV